MLRTTSVFSHAQNHPTHSEMLAQYRDSLRCEGTVRCRGADTTFWAVADPSPEAGEAAAYLGREIGASTNARDLVSKFDLKKRAYLGPTSMDNELSLVMANMGHARPGSAVFDPFAGTGSILIACAQFGAFTFGADIDIRVLRGKEGVSPFTNFAQYGLPSPELVRMDASRHARHVRERQPLYDAIVCDPPYGIRAGGRQSGSAVLRGLVWKLGRDHGIITKPIISSPQTRYRRV